MANEKDPKQLTKILAYWVIASIILDLLISLHIEYYQAKHSIFEVALQPITYYFVAICLIYVFRIITFGMLLDARRCYLQTITFILFNFTYLLWMREYHNNLMEMRDLSNGLYLPSDPRFFLAFAISKLVFMVTMLGAKNLNVLFKYYAVFGVISIFINFFFSEILIFNLSLGILTYAASLIVLIGAVWQQTRPPKGIIDDQLLDTEFE